MKYPLLLMVFHVCNLQSIHALFLDLPKKIYLEMVANYPRRTRVEIVL